MWDHGGCISNIKANVSRFSFVVTTNLFWLQEVILVDVQDRPIECSVKGIPRDETDVLLHPLPVLETPGSGRGHPSHLLAAFVVYQGPPLTGYLVELTPATRKWDAEWFKIWCNVWFNEHLIQVVIDKTMTLSANKTLYWINIISQGNLTEIVYHNFSSLFENKQLEPLKLNQPTHGSLWKTIHIGSVSKNLCNSHLLLWNYSKVTRWKQPSAVSMNPTSNSPLSEGLQASQTAHGQTDVIWAGINLLLVSSEGVVPVVEFFVPGLLDLLLSRKIWAIIFLKLPNEHR